MFENAKQFAEYLDELAKAGPKLREGGFLRVSAGEFSFDLVQMAGDLIDKADDKGKRVAIEDDPLNDPVSYGLNPDDPLPWGDDDTDEEGTQ